MAVLPGPPRLADALDRLDPDGPRSGRRVVDLTAVTRSDRLGSWVVRRLRLRVSDRTRTALRLQGRTIAEFYGDKAALAVTGAILPTWSASWRKYAFDLPLYVPAVAALIGAAIGFFVPTCS